MKTTALVKPAMGPALAVGLRGGWHHRRAPSGYVSDGARRSRQRNDHRMMWPASEVDNLSMESFGARCLWVHCYPLRHQRDSGLTRRGGGRACRARRRRLPAAGHSGESRYSGRGGPRGNVRLEPEAQNRVRRPYRRGFGACSCQRNSAKPLIHTPPARTEPRPVIPGGAIPPAPRQPPPPPRAGRRTPPSGCRRLSCLKRRASPGAISRASTFTAGAMRIATALAQAYRTMGMTERDR